VSCFHAKDDANKEVMAFLSDIRKKKTVYSHLTEKKNCTRDKRRGRGVKSADKERTDFFDWDYAYERGAASGTS